MDDIEAERNLQQWQTESPTQREHDNHEAKDLLEDVRANNDALERIQGQIAADHQYNLFLALKYLSREQLAEAIDGVEPVKLGMLWELLDERRAD